MDQHFQVFKSNVQNLVKTLILGETKNDKNEEKQKIREVKENFNSTKYVIRYVQQKSLSTLLLTAGIVFYNSKLRLSHHQRRLLAVSFIFISIILGCLTVMEFVYIMGHVSMDWELPDTKLMLALNLIGALYVILQFYIGYLIIIQQAT